MKSKIVLLTSLMTVLAIWSCTSKQEKMENRMKAFISTYEAKAIPLYRASAIASWNANVTGKAAKYYARQFVQ